jgi:hypothetical protein
MNIKNFNSFKEGLLSNLSSGIGKSLQGLKLSLLGSKESNELKKWNISLKKISDTYFQFLHTGKVIAELKLDGHDLGSPVFKLTIYFYESEIENKKNLTLNKKFEGQEEQPYAKGVKSFYSTKTAIDFLISYWSKNTNSGKDKNPDYKINL